MDHTRQRGRQFKAKNTVESDDNQKNKRQTSEGGPESKDENKADSENEAELELSAGDHLLNAHLELYFSGKLTAKRLCVLCWWASKAGVVETGPFALSPMTSSDQFQRKVDATLDSERPIVHDFTGCKYVR